VTVPLLFSIAKDALAFLEAALRLAASG